MATTKYNNTPLLPRDALRIQLKLHDLDEKLCIAIVAGERDDLVSSYNNIGKFYRFELDEKNVPTITILQKSFLDTVLADLHAFVNNTDPKALHKLQLALYNHEEQTGQSGMLPEKAGNVVGQVDEERKGQAAGEGQAAGDVKGKRREIEGGEHNQSSAKPAPPAVPTASTPAARTSTKKLKTKEKGRAGISEPRQRQTVIVPADPIPPDTAPVSFPAAPSAPSPRAPATQAAATKANATKTPASKAPAPKKPKSKPAAPTTSVAKNPPTKSPSTKAPVRRDTTLTLAELDKDDSEEEDEGNDDDIVPPPKVPGPSRPARRSPINVLLFPTRCWCCVRAKCECERVPGRHACRNCARQKYKCSHAAKEKEKEAAAMEAKVGKKRKKGPVTTNERPKKKRAAAQAQSEPEDEESSAVESAVVEKPKAVRKETKETKKMSVRIGNPTVNTNKARTEMQNLAGPSHTSGDRQPDVSLRSFEKRLLKLEKVPLLSDRMETFEDELRDLEATRDAEVALLIARLEVAEGQLASQQNMIASDRKSAAKVEENGRRCRNLIKGLDTQVTALTESLRYRDEHIEAMDEVIKELWELVEELQMRTEESDGEQQDDGAPVGEQQDGEDSTGQGDTDAPGDHSEEDDAGNDDDKPQEGEDMDRHHVQHGDDMGERQNEQHAPNDQVPDIGVSREAGSKAGDLHPTGYQDTPENNQHHVEIGENDAHDDNPASQPPCVIHDLTGDDSMVPEPQAAPVPPAHDEGASLPPVEPIACPAILLPVVQLIPPTPASSLDPISSTSLPPPPAVSASASVNATSCPPANHSLRRSPRDNTAAEYVYSTRNKLPQSTVNESTTVTKRKSSYQEGPAPKKAKGGV